MSYAPATSAATEEEYLRESVTILPEAIREEFVRAPVDMAFWGERYADAVKAFLLAEHEAKRTRALCAIAARETALARGQKLTVDQVNDLVETDAAYQQAKLAQIEAEAAKAAARARLDAVTAKKDMCVSLGAHIRQEMGAHQFSTMRG